MSSSTKTPLSAIVLLVVAVLPLGVHSQDKFPPNVVRDKCFSWFSENVTATLRIYEPDAKKETIPSTPSTTLVLLFDPDKPTNVQTNCDDPSDRSLSLSFADGKGATLDLSLSIHIRDKRHWHLDENKTLITVTTKDHGSTEFNLRKTGVTAGDTFSFSCSKLELMSHRATIKKPRTLTLVISRFQLQPFRLTGKQDRVFEDSFDCATWFTIPVWTGFLVILLFTAILSFGVFALLDIKTPDRFENPKGKTITVSATD